VTHLRLLHTSDLHIGADGGGRLTAGLAEALERIVQRERVTALLFAGDTFESNNVAADVVDASIDWMERLRRPIVILPGNHDCLDHRSVYHHSRFAQSEYIHLIRSRDGATVSLFGGELSVWGRAHEDHADRLSPLAGAPMVRSARWQVSIAHGFLIRSQLDRRRSYPIELREIDEAVHDYVALGHWDAFYRVPSRTPACYSGSPAHTGAVVLVELNHTATISQVRL
jgi:DNA repair exonuclease SbcCD nuclease subunit